MSENKKYLIIYHGEDNDGLFSGALFYDYLVRKLNVLAENIETLGANYNQLADFQKQNSVSALHKKYDSIIMTDISFNDPKFMKSLWNKFKSDFVWCDHHAPIIKESLIEHFDDTPGVRQSDRSAILCVWKYLYDPFDEAYNEKKIPELFRVLSAWDSWTYEAAGYEFDYVKAINKGTNFKFELNFNKVYAAVTEIVSDYLFEKKYAYESKADLTAIHTIGSILDSYDTENAANLIATAADNTWTLALEDGTIRTASALFLQGASNSTMFKMCPENIQHGIVFKRQPNSNWTFSLYNVRNDSDFHCGEFLKKKYNGGGHPGAAGCTITEQQFINILKNKQI